MADKINFHYIHMDTEIKMVKLGDSTYGMAFNRNPGRGFRKQWFGVACQDPEAAMAMSRYFALMANSLTAKKAEQTKKANPKPIKVFIDDPLPPEDG